MSKKDVLVALLGNSAHETINSNMPADEAYYNKLEKDIQHVIRLIEQADAANKDLLQYEDIASIEQKIVALFDSYERMLYIPDKNDTIGTAATSIILTELIERNTLELNNTRDIESIEHLIKEYKELFDSLKREKEEKQNMVDVLTKKIDEFKFTPLINQQISQTNTIHKDLQRMLKRIATKYLAMSEEVIDRAELNSQLKRITQLFDKLVLGNWVELDDYNIIRLFIDTLVKKDIFLINHADTKVVVKLRGFDIE